MKLVKPLWVALPLLCWTTQGLAGDNHLKLLEQYQSKAEQPLSAERGKALWQKRNGSKSCTMCHGSDITQPGEMELLFFFTKDIEPMALSANPDRYQDPETADKAFDKNCKRVFQRVCTPQEKGDILRYLVDS